MDIELTGKFCFSDFIDFCKKYEVNFHSSLAKHIAIAIDANEQK